MLWNMGHESLGPFITSLLELKLDINTMLEWQRHSQKNGYTVCTTYIQAVSGPGLCTH